MRSRLFCHHCEKYYEVDIKSIRLMQSFKDAQITFAHNTYFYKDDNCFFKSVNELKQKEK